MRRTSGFGAARAEGTSERGPKADAAPHRARSIGQHGRRQLAAHEIDGGGPAGGTPTGASIDKLIGRLDGGIVVDGGGFAMLATPGLKIIVLATDGEPDTWTDPTDVRAISVVVHGFQRWPL